MMRTKHENSEKVYLPIDAEVAFHGLDLTVEFAVDGVVLEHVNHIVQVHERVIDGHDVTLRVSNSSSADETPNAPKAVDSDADRSVSHCT